YPFTARCKRIAARFLEFINKNTALPHNGETIRSDCATVTITRMVAESKPEEKELRISLIMDFSMKH
ncbi:hypothetical protein LI129_24235, partial [Erysipelatoclostridium ramosum]|uniref:hypothetical protein n=1 Tax=Thomasclavelia ramosa TaxID=1547 RepID=UPI001D06AA2C|nr:hypothetical protein [Thomasclavelia ramosa]